MMSCFKLRYVTVWSEQQHHLHQLRSTWVIKTRVINLSKNILHWGFAKSNQIFFCRTFCDCWTNGSHNYWLHQNHHQTKLSTLYNLSDQLIIILCRYQVTKKEFPTLIFWFPTVVNKHVKYKSATDKNSMQQNIDKYQKEPDLSRRNWD